ncbi:sulfurtransferase [Halobellus limi]|uniref:Sulfurtransferase n=1 Tax=Halobellus limi TaxID=699433 RepID=A0A1H5YFW4_9EURY|nr:sulfurtransferase [Halobellus limi]QCC48467.1 sulfurtransferase [Halobellus limi]SEG22938.1 thiosulfate/3-mercaptopyruvate sulfurtransferase [Halobellus limi]
MTASSYPESVLVSPDWVAERLDRFESDDPGYRLLEVDVNTAFYDTGHAPGAVKIDWETDLRADDRHDIVGADELERLLGDCGITDETTVVVYGDDSNWFAAHMYWQLTYYGHPDVRIMDGGRGYWVDHGYPLSTASVSPPTVQYGRSLSPPADPSIRASREDVRDAIGTDTVFVDVRLPEEYRGEITAPPGTNETAMRGGHLPGAKNVFWADNVRPDMRFKSPAALREVYRAHGVEPGDDVIVYCRIGERSSLTWFALSELLGYESVRNYDGSWTEWGNMIGTPIETGE